MEQCVEIMPGKKKFTVNGPIDQLEELVRKAGIRLQSKDEPAPQIIRAPEKLKPEPVTAEDSPESSDDDVFTQAMNGIERVSWSCDPHPRSTHALSPAPNADSEAQRLMQEAMDDDSPIAILDHPEYIEGWVGVVGKRFLPNLRNGLYSIQGQIDLHGLNQAEAQVAVEDYITRMSRFRSCCIKIIHGRGINSPSDRATLKESLQRLLSTRRMSRHVVAYASAPSRDGGVGAVYVLLSRS
jgi:DNA-nicking Smr family endonuclease